MAWLKSEEPLVTLQDNSDKDIWDWEGVSPNEQLHKSELYTSSVSAISY